MHQILKFFSFITLTLFAFSCSDEPKGTTETETDKPSPSDEAIYYVKYKERLKTPRITQESNIIWPRGMTSTKILKIMVLLI